MEAFDKGAVLNNSSLSSQMSSSVHSSNSENQINWGRIILGVAVLTVTLYAIHKNNVQRRPTFEKK